jgi:hypothetical protein
MTPRAVLAATDVVDSVVVPTRTALSRPCRIRIQDVAGQILLSGRLSTIILPVVIGRVMVANVMAMSGNVAIDTVAHPVDVVHPSRLLAPGPVVMQALQGTGQCCIARWGVPLFQELDPEMPAVPISE